MHVDQAIKKTISEYGVDILSSPAKFQSLVRDFASNEREILLFSFCCQRGILTFAQDVVALTDNAEIKTLTMRTKMKLQEEAFMSETNVVAAINMFLLGLDIDYVLVADTEMDNVHNIDFHSNAVIDESKKQSHCRRDSYFDKPTETDAKMFLKLVDSADNMDIEAMILVGDFYRKGNIVKKNWRMAECYYKMAAERGSVDAQRKYIELLNERGDNEYR